jgi:hypothetical protein
VKRTVSILTILTIAAVILVSVSFGIRAVKADGDYSIEHVDHTIQVMYNGYIFINDTVTLNITGQTGPNSFLIGFPDKYGSWVQKCSAFSESNVFTVALNTPLEDRVGFYGVRVDFPQGAPQTFTVGFVLSNSLLLQDPQNTSHYTLNFPAYPSLTKKANLVNVSISLPLGTSYFGGTVDSFEYAQQDLAEFTYRPASLEFLLEGDRIQIVDVARVKREIAISEYRDIEGSDTYQITNRGQNEISHFEVFLPFNASNPSAEDQFGRKGEMQQIPESTSRYLINLTKLIKNGESSNFIVKYLLSSDLLVQKGVNSFSLNLSLFRREDYYINDASIAFILPEGAEVVSLENNLAGDVYSVGRSVFQETVTIDRQGITAWDNLSIGITYEYNPLWLSFRPTVWMWALAVVGSMIAAVAWRKPKGPAKVTVPTATMKLHPEYLKSFVDAYEEKKKIILEMDSLETRVQKGRIPRRRYKVRMKTLEIRLNTLSRSLQEFKERTRAAGGQYSDLMRQLEIAETEINEAETNIKSIEARHNRGELSLEAHRKLLADYQHKKESAESTINGILLRLREETR